MARAREMLLALGEVIVEEAVEDEVVRVIPSLALAHAVAGMIDQARAVVASTCGVNGLVR